MAKQGAIPGKGFASGGARSAGRAGEVGGQTAARLSFENLRQYLACRRNKRNTLNALKFEARQEEELVALREALLARTYVPARSVCFFAQGHTSGDRN